MLRHREYRQKTFWRRLVISALAAVLISNSSILMAADKLSVLNAFQIKFVVDLGGKVYLRNLDEFDPTWLGCCTNWWMDLSTDVGRAQFSAFLNARSAHSRVDFYVTSKSAGGPLLHVGDF